MKYCYLVLERVEVRRHGSIDYTWQSILSDELYDTVEDAKLASQQVMGASPHECCEFVLSWDMFLGIDMQWSDCGRADKWWYCFSSRVSCDRIAVQVAQLYIRHGQLPYCWYDESDEDTCYTTVQDEAKAQTS